MNHALRSLARRPHFSGTVILTLGLATGLVSAVPALLHEVLARPLPIRDATRLAVIYSTYPERGWERASAAIPELRDLAERGDRFKSVVVFALFNVQSMEARISQRERPQRFAAGVFAV